MAFNHSDTNRIAVYPNRPPKNELWGPSCVFSYFSRQARFKLRQMDYDIASWKMDRRRMLMVCWREGASGTDALVVAAGVFANHLRLFHLHAEV